VETGVGVFCGMQNAEFRSRVFCGNLDVECSANYTLFEFRIPENTASQYAMQNAIVMKQIIPHFPFRKVLSFSCPLNCGITRLGLFHGIGLGWSTDNGIRVTSVHLALVIEF